MVGKPQSAEMHPGPGFRLRYEIERPDPETVSGSEPASDAGDLGPDEPALRDGAGDQEHDRPGPAPGAARRCTVKVYPGDNLMVHKALDVAQPGDVIVVDTSSSSLTAVLGDLVCTKARHRGVAGFIVDGLIRDLPAIRAAGRLPRVRAGRDAEGPAAPRPGRDRPPDLLRRHRRQPRRRDRRRPERRRGRAAGHLGRAARRGSTRRRPRSRTTSPLSHAATSTTTGSTRCSRRAASRSGSPRSTSRRRRFRGATAGQEQGALMAKVAPRHGRPGAPAPQPAAAVDQPAGRRCSAAAARRCRWRAASATRASPSTRSAASATRCATRGAARTFVPLGPRARHAGAVAGVAAQRARRDRSSCPARTRAST